MLQRIYIDNYKRLVNFDLPLRELSLLLGRNGVGKTAVLDVVLGTESYRYRLEVEHERATRQARVHKEELSSNGKPLFRCEVP